MGKVGGKRAVGSRKKPWPGNIREWIRIARVAGLFIVAKDRETYANLTSWGGTMRKREEQIHTSRLYF